MKRKTKSLVALLSAAALLLCSLLVMGIGAVAENTAAYPTADGNQSAIFADSTIRLQNLGGNPVAGEWYETEDGKLVHKNTNTNFSAILYEQTAVMPDSYEISGKLTVDALGGLNSKLCIIYGNSALSGDSGWQLVTLAPEDENGAAFNLNYTNGYLASGHGWTGQANPVEGAWVIPAAGETVEFAVTLKDRYVTLRLGDTTYASYYLVDSLNHTDINQWFGFYADNLSVTLSDLYYGPIQTPNADGSQSIIFDDSIIRLQNLGGNPVVGEWYETEDGKLVHKNTNTNFSAILYEQTAVMPDSYEISGKLTVDILNNYTLPQTVGLLLLTVCGILILWVLLVLLYFLSQNLFGFIKEIWMEVYLIFN